MIVYCVLCACVFVCFCRQRLTASVKKVTKDARSSDPEAESDQGKNDTESTKEQLRNGDHESRAPSPYFHTRARTHTHTHTHTHNTFLIGGSVVGAGPMRTFLWEAAI